jgi:hypothetical protein
MDIPEEEIAAKDIPSPVSPQRDGSENDTYRSINVIGSKNQYSRPAYNASEDGAYSSYESLERTSLSERKRRKTTRNQAKIPSHEPKRAEKHDKLVQSATIFNNQNGSSPSRVGDIEPEWLLSKLEELQEHLNERLKRGLQRLLDEMNGSRPPCMHRHCTSEDLPVVSRADLHTTNVLSSLGHSTNCNMALDRQHFESPPALSLGPSISPVLLSATTPHDSSKDSPPARRAPESEKAFSGYERSPRFRSVDRHWDRSEQKFIIMEPKVEPGHDDATQAEDYIFVVRRDYNCNKVHVKTTVEIKDCYLRGCLQNIMSSISGVNFAEEDPVIDPKTLFL